MPERGQPLAGKTLIMSGGSRGIGLEIAKRVAADGANITLIAKTDRPHPKLPGTIHTAAAEIERAGGTVLKVVGDIRNDDVVAGAVEETVRRFGGIDLVLNNASAIDLSPTDSLPMKTYDLMQDINCRGSFALSKFSIPALRKSAAAGRDPHVLTMSPPLNLDPRWAGYALGYTIAKYGMSLITLGLAAELRADGIAVDSLWPRTIIATAAIRNRPGGAERAATARTPGICADAAYLVFTTPSQEATGNFYLDDEVLAAHGITELDRYRAIPGDGPLTPDLFL
ncbi:SDR family oxidoreductase [Nocardia sp. NPDC057668]|uniref:SDR family oxidoreductase n=1 Tax=Nocardia sp. NPDC057668 TaxID=3346202 RepID=UPI00366C29DA